MVKITMIAIEQLANDFNLFLIILWVMGNHKNFSLK